ncbi:MAG: PD-(D/E)XK nuclease superfamily protein [Verrucomicrobia bacterium ADurb.Bin118]|jgi:hypothetical protein|nr:MAG: PD-(D/E)XK nuclease superfamily protein [Verrucomicrobia bacterium ADurb.Bin118]
MSTVARLSTNQSAHWYLPDGTPFFEVPYADKARAGQMRPVTLRDARKVNALPSVTTVLRVLAKPELFAWQVEQAVLAVMTTPRNDGEADDAFVHRVLAVEKVHEQERDAAADLGTRIHAACAEGVSGGPVVDDLAYQYAREAIASMSCRGRVHATETVLVGDGYAGMTDLVLETQDGLLVVDWKTTKRLPAKAWPDHVMQLSAYAAALARDNARKTIRTANCYISTSPEEVGKWRWCEHETDWREVYHDGFVPALRLWQYVNQYKPNE